MEETPEQRLENGIARLRHKYNRPGLALGARQDVDDLTLADVNRLLSLLELDLRAEREAGRPVMKLRRGRADWEREGWGGW
jgi:hypothetical protein